MDIHKTEAEAMVAEINGLTAEFIAMVAEQCATIAATLPTQRIADGHEDSSLTTGDEIAAAIREQFTPVSIHAAFQPDDRMH